MPSPVRIVARISTVVLLLSAGAFAQAPKAANKQVDAATPVFSYISGPANCTQPAGYPDPALCVVPDEKPPGSFKPPGVGGSYIDPNFGAKVRILAPPTSIHGYASPNAMSASNKYALLSLNDSPAIVEVATGKKVMNVSIPFEGTMWDSRDDNILYYLQGATIQRYDLNIRRSVLLMDYSKPPFNFQSVKTGSSSDTSKDNWIPFFALAEKQICVFDPNRANTYCNSYGPAVTGKNYDPSNDAAIITKGVDSQSNKRYVILASRPIAIYSVNNATGKLDFETLGTVPGDHIDVFEDTGGIQYVFMALETATPCEFAVTTLQLNKGKDIYTLQENGGGRKRVFPLYNCGEAHPNWADWHAGCAKFAPYCVITTTYGGFTAQLDGKTPIVRTPHISEVMVMRGNGQEIRRLMQHRSVPIKGEDAQSYWTTPRSCISNDGSLVLGDSNFGEANKQRVFVVETGFGKTKIADSGVVNSAGQQSKISPGGLATVYGSNLANCRAAAAPPYPSTVCDTSVLVNGATAPVTYVSPEQINFLVPQATPPNKSARITVSRGSTTNDTDQTTVFDWAMLEAAPGVFSYQLDDGVARAVVQNSDATLNGPASQDGSIRPLAPGETGVIYAAGLGPVSPAVADGAAAPADPLSRTVNTTEVLINNVPQTVLFSGLAPQYSGLFQVNFVVDPATPLKTENDLQVRVRGEASPSLAVSISAQ